jgi:hypothetical protein
VVFDLTRKVHCNKMASEGFVSCADVVLEGRFQGEESKAHKPDKDEGVLVVH